MKPPHAAALALVGWYLMMPPTVPVGHGMRAWDATAPLSRWETSYAYDSAADCEAVLEEKRKDAVITSQPNAKRFVDHFRCIASDDSRLRDK